MGDACWFELILLIFLSAPSTQAQDEQEQVDEVQIETQRAQNTEACLDIFIALLHGGGGHAFDALGVVEGQSQEDENTGKSDDPAEDCVRPEHIDQHGNDQPDQSHK